MYFSCMFRWIFFSVLISASTCLGQTNSIVTILGNSLNETSGLINLNGRLITQLDSGGPAKLYEIDSTSGTISRTVTILQATNVDWEDLCFDDNYIYIGDIGNNAGTRTNLGIYRISRVDYFSTPNDTVTAEFISYEYADQTDFTPAIYSTNFDAEAFLSLGDSLYIFTKNWGNGNTNIYTLPKVPGNYTANLRDSVYVGAWITGATVNPAQDTVVLIGYSIQNSFLFRMTNFGMNNFSAGSTEYINVVPAESYQTEGIAIDGNHFLLTAEEHSSGAAAVYRVKINSGLGVPSFSSDEAHVVPNPASSVLSFPEEAEAIQLFDQTGALVLEVEEASINVRDLPRGTYLVKYVLHNAQTSERIVLK